MDQNLINTLCSKMALCNDEVQPAERRDEMRADINELLTNVLSEVAEQSFHGVMVFGLKDNNEVLVAQVGYTPAIAHLALVSQHHGAKTAKELIDERMANMPNALKNVAQRLKEALVTEMPG